MKTRAKFRACATGVLLGLCLNGCGGGREGSADLVLFNGQVHTSSGWTEAIAVKGGRVLATGSDADIRKLSSADSVDLRGRTVLPGLYDMHVHPMMARNGTAGVCRIEQGASAERLLKAVSACVEVAEPGEWVTGGQWQAGSMANTPITAATLDAVSPDNPVMLLDISGHSLWVNSRALQVAGIVRDTANPEGGIIERDANGAATGVLRETARLMVMRHVPPPTPEENVAALKAGLDLMLSYGIVGLTDAMVQRDGIVAYDTLAGRGELKQIVQACIAYSVTGKRVADFEALLAGRDKFAHPKFRADCVKVFADGVPTESHTAAMLDAYADEQPNAPNKGLLLFDPGVLNPEVARWDKMGLTVLFHAAGDAAVRASLDAIAFARRANGMGGPRHQVGHSTFVAPEDLARLRALNAAIEYSPYLWAPSPISDDIIKAIGPERIARVWPIRDGFDAGALVVAGSDWAVIPRPDPWLAIETSITRKAPGGGESAFGSQEAITIEQAMQMFTINAAKRLGIAGERGSLDTGKQAELIIVDRNPFTIPVTEIHKIKVEQTYIDGRKVFDREQPSS